MFLSCSTLGCVLDKYPNIEDTLITLKELGFHTIDLAAFENWQNVNPSKLAQPGELWSDKFISALKRTNLKVCSFNCGLSLPLNTPGFLDSEQVKDEFRALVGLADAVHCPNITVQPGNPLADCDVDKSLSTAAESLRFLAPVTIERGITLSVEGHQGSILENPDAAYQFMQSLWPDVGFSYDPSHWVMQDIDLPSTEPLLDFTYHVHVRNAALNKMQETMAKGNVDFEWLVNALGKVDYKGAISIEYFSDFDSDFKETLALRDLLRSLGVV